MGRMIDGDALEVVTAKVPKGMDAKSYMAGMEYVLSQIDALPTIEEHNTGKWIPYEFGDDTWHKCTACGIADHYISIVQRPNGTTGRLKSVRNFCPNCGAKMEGEENG